MSNSPATSLSSSTSGETSPGNSLAVLEDGSPNGSTLSWTSELNLELDRGSLSPRNRAVYDLIWIPISQGVKPAEIATTLQRAPSWVSDRLKEFYTEALFQQGVFPPLAPDEYQALRDSIAERGVEVPIIVDEFGEVIDGRMRRHIARELGVECPSEVRSGLSLDERRELAVTLNAPRRHMNRQQKRQLVVAELMVSRDRSDRAIGRLAGVDGKTVGKIRSELESEEDTWRRAQSQPPAAAPKSQASVEGAEIPQRPAAPAPSAASAEPAAPARNDAAVTERFQGHVECPCCQTRLELWRRAGEWMLDQPFEAAA